MSVRALCFRKYSSSATNILLGDADSELLAYSSIRLSLLSTTKTFIFPGGAVHAKLAYLASGVGMSLIEAQVLGECISRISSKCNITLALLVYETCRKKLTARLVRSAISGGSFIAYTMGQSSRRET